MALQHHHQVLESSHQHYRFRVHKLTQNFPHIPTQKCQKHFSGSIRCVATIQDSKGNDRRVAIYQPTSWSHDFVDSLKPKNDFSKKICMDKMKELEEKVRALVYDDYYYYNGPSSFQLLELIDDIERLGLGYHFQNDIKRILENIVLQNDKNVEEEEEKNLHEVSLRFRLLRQHGYDVSQDVFKRFINKDGSFMECLQKDIKGLLSLYEASYLALEGERYLYDAKLFATKKLKCQKNKVVMESITHALELPLNRKMPRLEARFYIDAYSKRKDANQYLLELATLDFNMVQSALQGELQDSSRWWRDIGLANKLSFARDRLMECFFWAVGIVFEPKYKACRLELTKVCAFITTIDDIYDVYGSLDELEQFTDVVKRWDIDGMKHLPDYLQVSFLALYNTVNEMAYNILLEQGINIIPILQKVWGELCESFLVEAKWSHSRFMPTLEDYLDNAWRSVSGIVILTYAYFLMSQNIKNDGHVSLDKYHELLKWSSMIFRLCNDLATSSDEIKSGKTTNAILCYMNESGNSEKVAREHVKTLIDEAWRKMIKARMACSQEFEDSFIDASINLARISHCVYQYGDGHGVPNAKSKDRVLSIIIEPITNRKF